MAIQQRQPKSSNAPGSASDPYSGFTESKLANIQYLTIAPEALKKRAEKWRDRKPCYKNPYQCSHFVYWVYNGMPFFAPDVKEFCGE